MQYKLFGKEDTRNKCSFFNSEIVRHLKALTRKNTPRALIFAV